VVAFLPSLHTFFVAGMFAQGDVMPCAGCHKFAHRGLKQGGRKMKQRMQGMVMGVLLTVLLLSATMVYANNRVTREITYGINVMLNGEMVQFDYDSRPFVMDGRTFLPLRTMAELVELPVDFDPGTNTAIVGRRYAIGTRVPLRQAAPHFDTGGGHGSSIVTPASRLMGGVTYQDPLVFRTTGNQEHNRFTMHNLNGQYRMLTGYIGRVDGTHMTNATIRFFGDGVLLSEYELRAVAMPIPISVFVEGVTRLDIQVIFPRRNTTSAVEYALIAFLE